MPWIKITTQAPPCIAMRPDGRRCRKKATVYDATRRGVVCAVHAGGAK